MRIEKERELGFGGGRSDQVQDRNLLLMELAM